MADGGNSELGVRNEKRVRKPDLPAVDDLETERRGCAERRERNVRNTGTATKHTSRTISRGKRIVRCGVVLWCWRGWQADSK
jgi:hypothetical protein